MAAAKDRRLYARIDIGFDEHDKIYPLSDAAFRALIEATLYSRRQLTDGFLAERLALKRWGADVLEELSTNDPEKPSLIRVDDGWQIHDFAEHQTTKADIEAKREHGKKGAAKRWAAEPKASPIAPAMGDPLPNDGGTLAKTETETETYIDKGKPLSLSDAEASDQISDETLIPENWEPTQKHRAHAKSLGIDVDYVARQFVEHANRTARKLKKWDTAFTNWMNKGVVMAQQRKGSAAPPQRKMTNAEIAMQELMNEGGQRELT